MHIPSFTTYLICSQTDADDTRTKNKEQRTKNKEQNNSLAAAERDTRRVMACPISAQLQVSVATSAFLSCSQTSQIPVHRFNSQLQKDGVTVPYPSIDAYEECHDMLVANNEQPLAFDGLSDCNSILITSSLALPALKTQERLIFEHMITAGLVFDEAYCQCCDWVDFGDDAGNCEGGIAAIEVVEKARGVCSMVKYRQCEYLANWAEKCYDSILSTFQTKGVSFRSDVRQCQFVTVNNCGIDLVPPIITHKADCEDNIVAHEAYNFYSAWKEGCSPLNDEANYNATDGIFVIPVDNGTVNNESSSLKSVMIIAVVGVLLALLIVAKRLREKRRQKNRFTRHDIESWSVIDMRRVKSNEIELR